MAHITSYWRSIKFNKFIARVQNKYYNKKRCATIAMVYSVFASIFSEVYLPGRTYIVQLFFCENRQVLTQGVIQGNCLGVGKDESSKPNPNEVS